MNACTICEEKFNRLKIGCAVMSGEVSRVFTGRVSENTYARIANTRLKNGQGPGPERTRGLNPLTSIILPITVQMPAAS